MSQDKQEMNKSKIQTQLSEKMMGVFDSVMNERKQYYSQNPAPSRDNASNIIAKYGNYNASISGGVGLVPGHWGMAAAVPEVILIIRNQLKMIYDVGMAYGKMDVLTKELLAGIFASAFGSAGIGVLTMHGSKVLVRRVSLRVFQRIIVMLGGKVSQQLLKSMISKWLPIVGAVAMATWSRHTTRLVGKKSIEIFSKDIEIEEEPIVEPEPFVAAAEPIKQEVDNTMQVNQGTDLALVKLKIDSLTNLMKADGIIADEEIEYIEILLKHSGLDEMTKAALRNNFKTMNRTKVDYMPFKEDPDEALGLLTDLIALAKRDGTFHLNEKMYIKHVGKLVGYTEADLNEMIEAN